MWHTMCNKLVASATLMLASLVISSVASAATINLAGDNSPSGGSGEFYIGQIGEGTDSDTVDLTVTPSESDIDILSTSLSGANVSGFTVTADTGFSESATYDASTNAWVLRFNYDGTTYSNYKFTINGTPGGYSLRASAVPLPAAAWMFLSALFGGAWLKRRGFRKVSARSLALATA